MYSWLCVFVSLRLISTTVCSAVAASPGALPHEVEVRGHVARMLLAHAEVWHQRRRADRFRIAYPAHHVLRGIGEAAREIRAHGDSIERRPDVSHGTDHTGDVVAGRAGILLQRQHALARVS